jgi:carbon storage regulator
VLVMRRRSGESFVIGDDIEIEVLEVSGARVKLGIVAPESIPITRKEARITRQENLRAARNVSPRIISSLLGNLRR